MSEELSGESGTEVVGMDIQEEESRENYRKKSSLAGSSEAKKKKLNNDGKDHVDMSEEERLYEESAKAIAEKVQRQQEGIESAMLSHKHKDETFKTVDEIQKLLEEQVGGMAGSMSRSKGFMSSFTTSSSSSSVSHALSVMLGLD